MLDINALYTSMMQRYIKRYQSWRTAQNLYNRKDFVINNSSSGIPCYSSHDIDQINNCNSTVVVIDNIKEGLHQSQYFSQYEKSKKYLIISGTKWNQEHYNWGFDYQVVWHNYYWYIMMETLANPLSAWFYQSTSYNWDFEKPWQFYSLTTQPRPYRLELADLLQQNIIGKNWVFRNNRSDYGIAVDNIDLVKTSESTGSEHQIPNRYKDFDNNFLATTCAVDLNVANRCWYHLISESDYGLNSFTPTEKTFKTLLSGQPFVIVGTKHFLKNLKELGFRTYNDLWDESYDDCDDIDRLQKIVKLCQELEYFDWQSARLKLQEIACYNRAQLLNLNTHADREFTQMEKCVVDFCNKWV